MYYRALSAEELEAYDNLAATHGTLFNRLDWIQVFESKIQPLGLFDKAGNMVGGMSIYRDYFYKLKVIRRAPFTPIYGPFMIRRAKNPASRIEETRKSLVALADYISSEAPAICMLPLDRGIIDPLPFFWRDYKVVPHITYTIDLTISLECIRNNMSGTTRNDVKKAIKDQLVVRPVNDMKIILDLVLKTFTRQSKHVNQECLERILFSYATPANSYAYATYMDDRPIAGVFIVHDKSTAYDLLAGYDEEHRHHGAGAYALFEAITHAQQLGLKTFDFEGSVIPPIERYFRGFGGQLVTYYSVNKAWLPLEIALKFIKRNLF